jgi:hypothetical protein
MYQPDFMKENELGALIASAKFSQGSGANWRSSCNLRIQGTE